MLKFSMDGNMNRDVHETVSQVYYEEELLYAALVELFFQMYTLFLFFFFFWFILWIHKMIVYCTKFLLLTKVNIKGCLDANGVVKF